MLILFAYIEETGELYGCRSHKETPSLRQSQKPMHLCIATEAVRRMFRDCHGGVEQAVMHESSNSGLVSELTTTHEWFQSGAPLANQYAIDTRPYMGPSVAAINRELLLCHLQRLCNQDSQALENAKEVASDMALLEDYYAIVRQSAEEQAMATMNRVFAESLMPSWRPAPAVLDRYITIGAEDDIPTRIGGFLSRVKANCLAQPDETDQVTQVISAVCGAFKAAAIVLLAVDVEYEIAGLLLNEVMCACAV